MFCLFMIIYNDKTMVRSLQGYLIIKYFIGFWYHNGAFNRAAMDVKWVTDLMVMAEYNVCYDWQLFNLSSWTKFYS